MPAQKPETLIQSQQVTLTGPMQRVQWMLTVLKLDHQWDDITVTIHTPSVTDATVGVTEDSQQNPRHSEAAVNRAAKAAFERMRDVDFSFRAVMPRSWEELTEASRNNWRDSAEAALNALPDAQGSVTEQSQQNRRQDYCPSCGYTKADQEINGDHYLCKNSGKAPWEPHHKEREEQGE